MPRKFHETKFPMLCIKESYIYEPLNTKVAKSMHSVPKVVCL